MTEHPRNFPSVLPSGWFQIGYSDEIQPGSVKPLKYFCKDLVMFRAEDGELAVLDAFCPHLGAHLGHGGKVKGNEIECPFHAWRFGVDGRCTAVPYAEHRPRKAALHRWHVREVANLVMCWHHHAGEPPQWDIPDQIPEWGTKDGVRNEGWTDWETAQWTVRSCTEEMSENAVDSAHFRYLHGTRNLPASEATFSGPVLRVCSGTSMETPRGPVDGSVESLAYGFGMGIVRFKGLVETLNIGTTTPIDLENCHLRFNFSVKKVGGADITRGVGKAFVNEVKRQVEQDIPVWENKIHLSQPLLCHGDGPIASYRRWTEQFYA
jgi:phenylpropionate dioxygenase-like ring-hydroxylating dioxygenase large terminal subunit